MLGRETTSMKRADSDPVVQREVIREVVQPPFLVMPLIARTAEGI